MTLNKTFKWFDCNRREFLVGTAALGTSLLLGDSLKPKADSLRVGEEVTIPTCCHMCGGGTGVIATVRDGVVSKLEPNVDNPIGVCNTSTGYYENSKYGAAMCPRGLSAIMSLYDPDRIKKPMLRTNPKKGISIDPEWQEISWEEALEIIQDKLKKLLDENRPEALITFSENSLFTDVQRDFCHLFGTPNVSFHTNICSVTRKSAAKSVLGVEEPLGDYQHCKFMLLFGWNPLSAVKWAHLPQIILNGKQNGSKLVVIDPRFSETAAKADKWLPILPGTDGALALALAHVIVKENLHNERFINDWTEGFKEYKEFLTDKTPEWAEKICGIPSDEIQILAREFASNQPAIADVWVGPGQQSNGFNASRAIFLLNVLVGNVDQPGGMMLTEEFKLGNSPIQTSQSKTKRFDGLENFPFGHRSGVYVEAIRHLYHQSGPYPLEVAFFTMSNPVLSLPNSNIVVDALKKLNFIVVIDNYISETALLADLVLPGTIYMERSGLVTRGTNWKYVALRQPVVEPLFGQLPEVDIFIELANRLELKDIQGKVAFKDISYEDYMDYRLQKSDAGITLAELKSFSGAVWRSNEETQFEKYKLRNNKFHFSISTLDLGNVDKFPVFRQRKWMPDSNYPFYLISWKHISHTHSRTQNNPYLSELKNQNFLYINPETAKSLSFNDGDRIRVNSPYGRVTATLRITPGIHPKVLGTEWGFGHKGFGKYAKDKGFSVNHLNGLLSDEITGQALHKEICVNIEKL
ncbi:molybdopterin-containing oxidoreductase family protein [Mesobacillus selenatarsenatis]|nr:molybdopterin-dependent oxidoreductase [Mesobacillus selenatarsenatis]